MFTLAVARECERARHEQERERVVQLRQQRLRGPPEDQRHVIEVTNDDGVDRGDEVNGALSNLTLNASSNGNAYVDRECERARHEQERERVVQLRQQWLRGPPEDQRHVNEVTNGDGVDRGDELVIMQAPVGNLNNARPPVNYVAGLGRGFTSFTTRSDIGHARVLSVGDQEGYDENQTFDESEGNDVGLFFASAEYNEEDKEADAIWDDIDKRMDSRRKDRREARVKEEIEKYRVSNTKITEQFVDLKRKLVTLSDADWDGIPEIGDYSSSITKKRFESCT
nr:protein stabilized1-like [Tanacetum cinerariifolium]